MPLDGWTPTCLPGRRRCKTKRTPGGSPQCGEADGAGLHSLADESLHPFQLLGSSPTVDLANDSLAQLRVADSLHHVHWHTGRLELGEEFGGCRPAGAFRVLPDQRGVGIAVAYFFAFRPSSHAEVESHYSLSVADGLNDRPSFGFAKRTQQTGAHVVAILSTRQRLDAIRIHDHETSSILGHASEIADVEG